MNKPSIMTIIIIICILIIGLYALGEVDYFSYKTQAEGNIQAPTVVIPSIGVQEKINNIGLEQGVYTESTNPTDGDIILFGHRTLQGSPFLRLNDVHNGDMFLIEWPGIGELKYNVVNTEIVPATASIPDSDEGNSAFLVTCDPIGSTENRLIIQGKLTETNPLNSDIINSNPQGSYGLYITGIFLILGLLFSYFYPKENRIYILATVLIITVILLLFCIHPIPSQIIYDKIGFLNGGSGWA